VLSARDMMQHCDVALMLDNDSLLKQAAAEQAAGSISSPGGAGMNHRAASGVGVSLSDGNKVSIPSTPTHRYAHIHVTRLQRAPSWTCCVTRWLCH
jgi:hypothetical protein